MKVNINFVGPRILLTPRLSDLLTNVDKQKNLQPVCGLSRFTSISKNFVFLEFP